MNAIAAFEMDPLFFAQCHVADVALDAIEFDNIKTENEWDSWCNKYAQRIEQDADMVATASTLLTEASG